MRSNGNLKKSLNNVIDAINKSLLQHNGVIFIGTDEEIIHRKCFGYADIQKKSLITNSTQFLAGSVTKQFTAVAILKALLDENIHEKDYTKLRDNIQAELNNTIDQYLSGNHEIWNGVMPAWASKVTIHQLLVHSSGIPNYTSLPTFENQKFSKNSDLVNFFKGHELEFNPGEKFSYSNSGYYLLGIIIEEIVQKKLDVYLEKTFFKPLEMKSTFFPMQGTVDELIQNDARFINLARGYQYDIVSYNANLDEIKRYERMEVPGAAGSLITTAEDLLKWNNALYNEKIIPEFVLKLILHPYLVTERDDAYYGYGIEIMKSESLGTYYSHRGGIPGFRSILTYIPSLKLSIAALQNIVADQEKIIPEVKQLQKNIQSDLSQEEVAKQLTDIIETKYPVIVINRKKFELAPVYEAMIKMLENIYRK